jgi:hypothetical protein
LSVRAVTARIQRVQREEQLLDFAAAAARVFQGTHPGHPLPKTTDEIVEALRERELLTREGAIELAARRADATCLALTERARVEGERLRVHEEPAPLGVNRAGRVEFELSEYVLQDGHLYLALQVDGAGHPPHGAQLNLRSSPAEGDIKIIAT